MAVLDGKLLTVDMTIRVWGVNVGLKGTVEILDVSKRVRSAP
jgi:hypothetical protein